MDNEEDYRQTYRESRESAVRTIDSSFRDRASGLEGLRSDINLLVEMLTHPAPSGVNPDAWRSGIIDLLGEYSQNFDVQAGHRFQTRFEEAYGDGYNWGLLQGDPVKANEPEPEKPRRRSSRR